MWNKQETDLQNAKMPNLICTLDQLRVRTVRTTYQSVFFEMLPMYPAETENRSFLFATQVRIIFLDFKN